MSKPVVQSYLFFNGNCEEALEFYKTTLDAKVDMVMRFSDSPEPCTEMKLPPGHENKIMHASFHVGDTMIMASDGCGETQSFAGFSLSLALGTEAEADKYFNALAVGGEVITPLAKTFWSPRFGMLKDKFGMGWMINVIPVEP